ncbi:hypothetical protein [Victivallis vadensis]|uniref:hypothetical protein n=1 Tax=Victivallis vadensis TaxID=172901 RepID=UPI003AF6975B
MHKRRHQIGPPFYLPGAVIAAAPAWLLTNWFYDTEAGPPSALSQNSTGKSFNRQ